MIAKENSKPMTRLETAKMIGGLGGIKKNQKLARNKK